LVLAIAQPRHHWVLLDSNGKKTRFLEQASIELGLRNVEVVQARAEDYKPAVAFDVVTSRAVGSLWSLVCASRHLWFPHGAHFAMKGSLPQAEMNECVASGVSCAGIQLRIPGLDAERFLVRMSCGRTGKGNASGYPCVE
jgi:16S rRNA (guanine527-N7)-methyltransferase